jgi:RNA polymerase sigma-70 factor (ECF subfamily)
VYFNSDAEDAHAVRRCLEGDSSAFRDLVERHHRPLYHTACRLLADPEDARDATQNTFLKAYASLETFDQGRRFFSWIYRILVNECLNIRRARHPMDSLDGRMAEGASPRDGAENAELRVAIRQALLGLSPEHRDVIVLRHFGGLTYHEMAAELGIPEKTVKSRLFEARHRLAQALAPWS